LIHLVNKRCRYDLENPKSDQILTLFDMIPTLIFFSIICLVLIGLKYGIAQPYRLVIIIFLHLWDCQFLKTFHRWSHMHCFFFLKLSIVFNSGVAFIEKIIFNFDYMMYFIHIGLKFSPYIPPIHKVSAITVFVHHSQVVF